jgi:hypothetical protein
MNTTNRLQKLAGVDPKRELIEALKKERDEISVAHDILIEQIRTGAQIDEGLFSTLKAAMNTAIQVSTKAASSVVDKAKALAAPIKQLYLDNKAKEELIDLTKGIGGIITSFDKIESDAHTILSRDTEVQKEIQLFKDLLQKTFETLTARLNPQQSESLEDPRIKDMMIEHGYLEIDSVKLIMEAAESDDVIAQVLTSKEYQDAASKFKVVSTKRELAKGVISFDVGVKPFDGLNDPKSKTVLKAFPDGQLKGVVTSNGEQHTYLLGLKIISSRKDQTILYRAMIKEIVRRGEDLKSNHEGRMKEIESVLAKQLGSDAVKDDGQE